MLLNLEHLIYLFYKECRTTKWSPIIIQIRWYILIDIYMLHQQRYATITSRLKQTNLNGLHLFTWFNPHIINFIIQKLLLTHDFTQSKLLK